MKRGTLPLLLTGFLGAACAPDPDRLNVIVIVLDTLRADAISAYGIPWSTTPTLDALATGGVQWRTCVAQSPWTSPSVGTILTGEYPTTHGATDFVRPLDEELPTLAGHFQAAGYRTYGAVSSWLLGPRGGFDAGFERFEVLRKVADRPTTSPAITDFGIDRLKSGEGPFFLFLHYYDAHFPYRRHPISRITPYGGTLGGLRSIWDIRERAEEAIAEDRHHLRELYQGEVAYIDRELGRLVRCLEELGLRERTLLVVTADHGEEILEDGWLGHTIHLRESLVRVPLIFHWPSRLAPTVREDVAAQLDILPSVLELAGLPAAAGPGRELFAGGVEGDRSVFSEVEFEGREERQEAADQRSIRRGRWKAIEDRAAGTWSLHDLVSDPLERVDRAAAEDSVLADLREELLRWAEHLPRATHAGGTVSEEEHESLRALGYVN